MIELSGFLGNPGKKYSRHRHNAGFMLSEKPPFSNLLSWQKKFRGLYAPMERKSLGSYLPASAENACEGIPVNQLEGSLHFIKPETYMNLSGEPISEAASFFKIKHENIIIIHDELELALGTISLKFAGGLGGHNGLRSIKACLGSPDFWRIRIGIGRPNQEGEAVIDWVLSNFSSQETESLNIALDAAAELLLLALTTKPENLLNTWGKRKLI